MEPATDARSALLVLDFQVGIVAAYGAGDPGLVDRAAAVVAAARGRMPVIFVRVAYRPGHPEIGAQNPRLAGAVKERGLFLADSEMAAIHPRVAPAPDEVVVDKRRINAFWGTDLELILRAQSIEALTLFGVATSGVVLSTVRHAFDADYDLTVIEDCCVDADPQLHRVLLDQVIGRQARLLGAEAFVAAGGGAASS